MILHKTLLSQFDTNELGPIYSAHISHIFHYSFLFNRAAVILIWVPAFIADHIEQSGTDQCVWDPHKNRNFAISMAICGYHIPSTLMVFCYVKVLLVMRRGRASIKPDLPSRQSENINSNISNINNTGTTATADKHREMGSISSSERRTMTVTTAGRRTVKCLKCNCMGTTSDDKERRIFITLSCIVIGYLICWTPWHFIFDMLILYPGSISRYGYTFVDI